MIVYGDRVRTENTRQLIIELEDECRRLIEDADRTQQSDRATSLLISTGELSQGLLDEQCREIGFDEWTPLCDRCAYLTVAAAALAIDGYAVERVEAIREELARLREAALPARLTIKTPEGYAFYAVYPRLYEMAARAIVDRDPAAFTVIGLRSIGTSLAAVVAYAAGAHLPPMTVRPQGHPFERRLHVGEGLAERILRKCQGRYAIVDEGPGLSGSSFLAVAEWLIDHGVSEEQLEFFPSHGNEPGAQATPKTVARWRRVRRQYVDFGAIQHDVLEHVSVELPRSHEDGTWKEISAGEWRRECLVDQSQWPPAHVQQERRKYLFEGGGKTWLAKFAGLGPYGQSALVRGKRLSDAGFIPPVHGLRDGFLVQEWLADAPPLLDPRSLRSKERSELLETVARYLEFEADHFPATRPGAVAEDLWNMARFNLAAHFGDEYEVALNELERHVEWIAKSARPVNTDNKMQPWEWLRLPDGGWLKADALEHHADHQCIGPQDIAWDVAGAICEFQSDTSEADELWEGIADRSLVSHSSESRAFYQICYLAFQLGYFSLAATAVNYLTAESSRLSERRDYFAARLTQLNALN